MLYRSPIAYLKKILTIRSEMNDHHDDCFFGNDKSLCIVFIFKSGNEGVN